MADTAGRAAGDTRSWRPSCALDLPHRAKTRIADSARMKGRPRPAPPHSRHGRTGTPSACMVWSSTSDTLFGPPLVSTCTVSNTWKARMAVITTVNSRHRRQHRPGDERKRDGPASPVDGGSPRRARPEWETMNSTMLNPTLLPDADAAQREQHESCGRAASRAVATRALSGRNSPRRFADRA